MSLTCPQCGIDVSPEALYCPACGLRLPSAKGHPAPPGPYADAHPSGLAGDVRNWAMLSHLIAFAGFVVPVVGSIVGPLAVWLLKREEHPFIDEHGKEALNFNISVAIYALVSGVLVLVVVGILMLVVVGIVWFILVLVATVNAANGRRYRYPLTLRFVS